jgi:hypothetical protein
MSTRQWAQSAGNVARQQGADVAAAAWHGSGEIVEVVDMVEKVVVGGGGKT